MVSAAVSSDVLDDDGSETSQRFEPSGRRATASQPREQPDDGDEDEQDLFITPVASLEISHTSFERTHRVPEGSHEMEKATPLGGQGSAWKYFQTKSH